MKQNKDIVKTITKEKIKYQVIKLIGQGLTYRQVAEKVGLKSTNSVSHYVRHFNGKRIYLTELERSTIKKVIEKARLYGDDADTYRITNSILSKL